MYSYQIACNLLKSLLVFSFPSRIKLKNYEKTTTYLTTNALCFHSLCRPLAAAVVAAILTIIDGNADSNHSNAILAGGCGDKSDDKKDGKSDSIQSNAVLAGGCGDKSDDKKDGKSDFTVPQSAVV
jgi:hypothetical protein